MKKSILFLLPILLLANSCFAQGEEGIAEDVFEGMSSLQGSPNLGEGLSEFADSIKKEVLDGVKEYSAETLARIEQETSPIREALIETQRFIEELKKLSLSMASSSAALSNTTVMAAVAGLCACPVAYFAYWYAFKRNKPLADYCDLTSLAPKGKFYNLMIASKALNQTTENANAYAIRRIASSNDLFAEMSDDDKQENLRKNLKKELLILEKVRRSYISDENKSLEVTGTNISTETINTILKDANLKDTFNNRNYVITIVLTNVFNQFVK